MDPVRLCDDVAVVCAECYRSAYDARPDVLDAEARRHRTIVENPEANEARTDPEDVTGRAVRGQGGKR